MRLRRNYGKLKKTLQKVMGLLEQYLWAAFISMIPVIELRGGMLYAQGAGLDFWWSLLICAVANMLPVPII